ncbi:beta-lactamase family protein [Bacillus sp. es.036]|nr:beta-lactamase family protein [Bacillus sp. es.036]
MKKLKEIEIGEVGIKIYSTKDDIHKLAFNNDLIVPLASAAKVAIGFCVTKWVEEELINWDDIVKDIFFNPNEDSRELYPHFQLRESLPLREAVEVMIACHDSYVAKSIVEFCGGWKEVNNQLKTYYPSITVTEDPRNAENQAQLDQLCDLMLNIFQNYKKNPLLWTPIINGLIRQKGEIEGIPTHHLNHMTGGLENVVVDLGIIGDFNNYPYVFVLGATNLPNRNSNLDADNKIIEAVTLIYKQFKAQ